MRLFGRILLIVLLVASPLLPSFSQALAQKALESNWGVSDKDFSIMPAEKFRILAKMRVQRGELGEAAEQGDIDAMVILGSYLVSRWGYAERNEELGAKYLKTAAKSEHPRGMELWASLLFWGDAGVTENKTEAVEWYRKAADKGNAIAQLKLGRMYQDGDVVSKDLAKATALFRKAADQGEVWGQYFLGKMLLRGGYSNGVPQATVELIRSSAKADIVPAMVIYAEMYDAGIGVAYDPALAEEWYTKATVYADLESGEIFVVREALERREDVEQQLSSDPEKRRELLQIEFWKTYG